MMGVELLAFLYVGDVDLSHNISGVIISCVPSLKGVS